MQCVMLVSSARWRRKSKGQLVLTLVHCIGQTKFDTAKWFRPASHREKVYVQWSRAFVDLVVGTVGVRISLALEFIYFYK